MAANAIYFGLKQCNSLSQFVLGIGIEEFPGQLAGCIAFRPGTIIELHDG